VASPSGPELLAEAQGLLSSLSAFRRDLHRRPELGGQELRTAARVAAALQRLGLEVRTGVAGHGVVGLLRARAGTGSAAIALRADMDALPVQEDAEAPHRSLVPGVSHACGHDGHTAIQLGAAELLRRHAADLPGDVLFLFQPSEDTLPGGARGMVREGALRLARRDGATPSGILSLHLNPLFPAGTVALREGWTTCSSASFRLRLQGRGGHVADPGHVANPLLPAAALITATEALRRELAAEAEPLILAFGSLRGGSAANIIPDAVEASGSLRAPSPELLQRALDRFRELARSAAENAGTLLQLELEEGYPPVFNDPLLSARFREAAAAVVGPGGLTSLDRPLATGDDVSFFHREMPGVYWQLGSADPARGFSHPLHSPRFDFGEELLALGAAVQASAVLSLLAGLAGGQVPGKASTE
jgi:amidohydrolase